MLAQAEPSMLRRYHFKWCARGLVDDAVFRANNYRELMQNMEVASLPLYSIMRGTPLVRVMSPLLIAIAYMVTWEVTDYLLHWSRHAVGLSCFIAVFVSGYLTRYFATIPVSSFR